MGEAARQGQRKGDFLAGKYLLEDCLGIGGMGEVYRATNVSLGRKVAIKLLSREYVHIEDDVNRFLREARAAAAVRHPNVVDVLDVARDEDGTPFIVQELLAGQDLEQHLKSNGGRLAPAEALEIMIPVADAVAAAHAHDVVHRDLKPANIFLAREGGKLTPKVLDFGACLFPTMGEMSAKERRMLIGTPHYMAPEQIVSKGDIDARSDVWALGVILYEILVGQTPFEAESAKAVMDRVKTTQIPKLRAGAPRASKELEELVAACIERDRDKRLKNARAMHERMTAIRDGARTAVRTQVDTLQEHPDAKAPPAMSRVPSLATPTAPAKRGPGLFTLASPGSEPPGEAKLVTAPPKDGPAVLSSLDELALNDPIPSSRPPPPAKPGDLPLVMPRGVADLAATPGDDLSLDLEPPASWRGEGRGRRSSIPPVLDPKSAELPPIARATASTRPPPVRDSEATPPPAPPSSSRLAPTTPSAAISPPPRRQDPSTRPWTSQENGRFAGMIAGPALVAFGIVMLVSALSGPVGRALRGDSPIASGVLALTTLVLGGALVAKSISGTDERAYFVATGGSVLFGIVMIIVTFSAGEAVELGVPTPGAAITPFLAPIAPLAIGWITLKKAREVFRDPVERRDAILFTGVTSLLVFLALVLSPVGAVRVHAARSASTQQLAP